MIAKGGQRLGRRAAKASEASLSVAAAKTLRTPQSLAVASCHGKIYLERSAPSSIARRTHPSCVGLPQLADQKFAETYFPGSFAQALEADWITYEWLSDKPFSALPFDLSVAPYTSHLPVCGVPQPNPSPLRRFGAVKFGRRSLPQCLVWSHLVVSFGPTGRPPLLRTSVLRSRSCCLGLEHPVHLFVCSVLFGMPGSNELDMNPQSGPPSTQTRKPERSGRSKGLTVVYSDNVRVTILPKQSNKNPPYRPPTLIPQQANSQQVTAEQIPYCQWLDPLAIPGSKPTFEIHRPDLIASDGHRQAIVSQLRTASRTPPADSVEPHSLEPVANGARCWRSFPAVHLPQPGRQLSAPPTSVAPPYPANSLHPHSRRLARTAVRTRTPISQSWTSFAFETPLPLIPGLATDSEGQTQPRHASLGLQSQLHELQPLRQTRDFFPRHDRGKGRK